MEGMLAKESLEETRVIFYAYTSYHLFYSVYYAMQVHWKENTKKYLIWYKYNIYAMDLNFLNPYFDDVIVITDPENDSFLLRQLKRSINGGYLFRYSQVGRFLASQRQNNIFVCFSDQNDYVIRAIALIKRNKNNAVIMVEEGDATYAFPKYETPTIYNRLAQIVTGSERGRYIGHTGAVDVWIVRQPETLPLKKKGVSTVIKQNDIFADKEWTNQFSFLWRDKLSVMPAGHGKKKILWIGGPIEVHGVAVKEELLWLMEIADAVQDKYMIYIKQHPRERDEKYAGLVGHSNIEMVGEGLQWIPMEFLVNMFQPDIILTVSSSAAFHIYEGGFKGKVIYTYRRFKDIQIDQDVIVEYAKKENIYDVKNLDELKHIIYDVELKPRESTRNCNMNEDLYYFENVKERF